MDQSKDEFWSEELRRAQELKAERLRKDRARRTLTALGLYHPLRPNRIEYRPLPDHKFFPLWAFQHQKAIRRFVAITGGDETDEQNVVDCAIMLWQKDPKAVEYNLN